MRKATPQPQEEMTLTQHLSDLRGVLIVSLGAFILFSIVAFTVFGERLIELVVSPLQALDVPLVYIGVAEGLLTKFKISMLAGFVASLPVILWKVWSFVAPGLTPSERRLALAVIPFSLMAFALGFMFAYYVVFKYALYFLVKTAVGDTYFRPMLSVGQYVSFLVSFTVPFGLVFQLPLVAFFLSRAGIVSYGLLVRVRKYAILVIFIVAAVLTPPDVVSQVMMAGPLLVLYEMSILVARFARPRRLAKPAPETGS